MKRIKAVVLYVFLAGCVFSLPMYLTWAGWHHRCTYVRFIQHSGIYHQIEVYAEEHQQLPESLLDIVDYRSGRAPIDDVQFFPENWGTDRMLFYSRVHGDYVVTYADGFNAAMGGWLNDCEDHGDGKYPAMFVDSIVYIDRRGSDYAILAWPIGLIVFWRVVRRMRVLEKQVNGKGESE